MHMFDLDPLRLNIRETPREKARRPGAGASTLFQLTHFRNVLEGVLEGLSERDNDSQNGVPVGDRDC